MDSRRPPEFALELSADRSNIKDVTKGEDDLIVSGTVVDVY
jgi:hypothetical protein